MKSSRIFILAIVFFINLQSASAQRWQGNWITAFENQNATNTWIAYHKTFQISGVPEKAMARIAVDSKYWLWINGELVVFEGQLKRGPTPHDTYYDQVNIAPFLRSGENKISVLAWYFGKDGFSHKSSGGAGFIFECLTPEFELISDPTWYASVHPAFGYTGPPHPNFRLPESNIHFDARRGNLDFTRKDFIRSEDNKGSGNWSPAKMLGSPPMAPWNQLIERPVPLWKDYGLTEYVEAPAMPFLSNGDTIVCKLPYNAQVTPYFEVEAPEGETIHLLTDHYAGGGPVNVRGEYVTKQGVQEYENLGWMNGHNVFYVIPKGITVLSLKYRETGYNAEFAGGFSCNDPLLNELWKKAARTLYITMRDTYMDCPDRERSQWWGDMVVESGEAFYSLSPESRHLTRKGILELINWQRKDSTIYSPIPTGNWDKELPGQMLSSVGYFGFWNYYWNSGDLETIEQVYEGVGKYLAIWKLDERGVLQHREGGWYWGDWGVNADKALLINEWYYLALEGYKRMSEVLGNQIEVKNTIKKMIEFKKAFNATYWTGDQYRSNQYKGEIDDRSQALAVVAGLADKDKFGKIYKLLQTQMYASPYMEKYVIEALFLMGQPEFALERLKKRFSPMIEHPEITTLWEGWGIGRDGFGGGSTNHAWSGGGLTILSQYVAGVYPLEAAYKSFSVKPTLAQLNQVSVNIPSLQGLIKVEIQKTSQSMTLKISVPEGSQAVIHIPEGYRHVSINGSAFQLVDPKEIEKGIIIPPGEFTIIAH